VKIANNPKEAKELGFPSWVCEAEWEGEMELLENGTVVFKNGIWKDGIWNDGIWENGLWKNGTWKKGKWYYGTWGNGIWEKGTWCYGIWKKGLWYKGLWKDGIWKDGMWKNGRWKNGIWEKGIWENGIWKTGKWQPKENRILHFCYIQNLKIENDIITTYRATRINKRGIYNHNFFQEEGIHFYDCEPPGSGTCKKGIHVTTYELAKNYFKIPKEKLIWEVKVHVNDILDHDGQKMRIRGGEFKILEEVN